MNEQLKLLVGLQAIDSSVLLLAEQIDSLPGKLKQYRAPLNEANDLLQKVRAKCEILNKNKKDKDMQLDEFQDKIDKIKTRSTEVKTNKEYEAHLKEIGNYEKNKYKIEDEILLIMEEIETFSKTIKEAEARVKKAGEAFIQEESKFEIEKAKLFSEIEAKKAGRAGYLEKIEKEIYYQYMQLLKKHMGLAVVETKNEVCLGCNTNIPPQLFSDIIKGESVQTCFYCNRFLYFKEEPAASNNNPEETAPAS